MMEVELLEIRDFLSTLAPFDQLPAETLDRLPTQLAIRYQRRGQPFPPADATTPSLYIIRKGALELRDSSQTLVGKYADGDLYPTLCMSDALPGLQAVTSEDSLFYALPCPQLNALCEQFPALKSHFHHSATERLRSALAQLQQSQRSNQGGLLTLDVGDLIGREAVTAPPHISIREAAKLMTQERVSSLLIIDQQQLIGLVTDRDLRSRCIAEGLPLGTPVTAITTRKLHKVSHDTPAFEALLEMTRLNIHHLPVTGHGRVLGVITTNDLIRRESANAVYMVGDINRATTLEALQQASQRLPELQLQIVNSGATGYHLGQAITAIIDALTRRLLWLAEQQLGEPPIAYCWVAVGSQARREQTIRTDQDSALLLADDYQHDRHGDYFAQLTAQVTDGLASCGIPHCPGEVMARNPQWRQPVGRWRGLFDEWIERPERKALMLASNFFDMRPVAGSGELFEQLQHAILARVEQQKIFLAALAANALRRRPPLGFFRSFVLSGDGDHADTVDLKLGGLIPVVDLVRVFALSAGVSEINSYERLHAAAAAGAISQHGAADLEDALTFISTLRARHQSDQIGRGEAPDNYIHPDHLSHLERNHLKDAFSVIANMQKTLAQRYQTERFT